MTTDSGLCKAGPRSCDTQQALCRVAAQRVGVTQPGPPSQKASGTWALMGGVWLWVRLSGFEHRSWCSRLICLAHAQFAGSPVRAGGWAWPGEGQDSWPWQVGLQEVREGLSRVGACPRRVCLPAMLLEPAGLDASPWAWRCTSACGEGAGGGRAPATLWANLPPQGPHEHAADILLLTHSRLHRGLARPPGPAWPPTPARGQGLHPGSRTGPAWIRGR